MVSDWTAPFCVHIFPISYGFVPGIAIIPWKYHQNPFRTFWDILQTHRRTDRQTDRQTDRHKPLRKHNFVDEGNYQWRQRDFKAGDGGEAPEGVPLPTGAAVWEGGSAPPQKKVFCDLNMACFGELWGDKFKICDDNWGIFPLTSP